MGKITILAGMILIAVLLAFFMYHNRLSELNTALGAERIRADKLLHERDACNFREANIEQRLQICTGVSSAKACDCSCGQYVRILMDTVDYLKNKPDDYIWWDTHSRGYKYYRDRGFILNELEE